MYRKGPTMVSAPLALHCGEHNGDGFLVCHLSARARGTISFLQHRYCNENASLHHFDFALGPPLKSIHFRRNRSTRWRLWFLPVTLPWCWSTWVSASSAVPTHRVDPLQLRNNLVIRPVSLTINTRCKPVVNNQRTQAVADLIQRLMNTSIAIARCLTWKGPNELFSGRFTPSSASHRSFRSSQRDITWVNG